MFKTMTMMLAMVMTMGIMMMVIMMLITTTDADDLVDDVNVDDYDDAYVLVLRSRNPAAQ